MEHHQQLYIWDFGIIYCAIWENTNSIYSEIRPQYTERNIKMGDFPAALDDIEGYNYIRPMGKMWKILGNTYRICIFFGKDLKCTCLFNVFQI